MHVPIKFLELLDFCSGHRYWVFEHKPSNVFCARRRGERSRERVISKINGQQGSRIDLNIVHLLLALFLLWQIGPQLVNQSVIAARFEQNGYHLQITLLIGVHQINRHSVSLDVDLLLAGSMKVELLQHVPLVAHLDKAPGGVVDHDGMTIINNVQWDGL